MSEESKVQMVGDDGYKNRWSFSKAFLRQEGRKTSLNGKIVAFMGLFVLGLATFYVLLREAFRDPPSENKTPIGFNGQVSPGMPIDVPAAGTFEAAKQKQPKMLVIKKYPGLQVVQRPRLGKIPPGSMVKAKFVTGASNGPLKAVLTESLLVNGEGVLEEGTVLVGQGNSTEDRLMVQFNKIVFKDGASQNTQAQACDESDQTVGVKGQKISKHALMFASGAGLNFLGGLAQGLQDTEVQGGVATKRNDFKNAALNGASTAALDQSKEVLSELRQKKTVIQVDSGKEFYVLFDGE